LSNLVPIVYKITSKSFLNCIIFLSNRHSSLHEILVTEQQFQMPKSKLFKHLPLTRENVESLHQLSPSLPTNTNPVVIQQTNTKDISAPIANDVTHSADNTETQPTLILPDRITDNPIKKFSTFIKKPNDNLSGTPSAPPIKYVSNVSWPQNLPSQTQDPKHTFSHSQAADISESLTVQVNSRPHKLDLQTRKQRRHQYRLCYNCRQTHLKTRCPQLIQK